jgi:uncharacterized protein YjbI with pentapeptide repeats
MNSRTLLCALAFVSTPALAQVSFDEATGACLDADGRPGFNSGVGPCADLRGAQLGAADLSGVDLRGARLDGAHLAGAVLSRTNLRGASLDGADLTRATLTGASLEAASLKGARLTGAHLEFAVLKQAKLEGADLRSACLYRTTFADADLRAARFSRTAALLQGARWEGAVVYAQTLPFAAVDLRKQKLNVVDLVVAAR